MPHRKAYFQPASAVLQRRWSSVHAVVIVDASAAGSSAGTLRTSRPKRSLTPEPAVATTHLPRIIEFMIVLMGDTSLPITIGTTTIFAQSSKFAWDSLD